MTKSFAVLALMAILLVPAAAQAGFVEMNNGLVLQSSGGSLDFGFSILQEDAGYESEFGYFDINSPSTHNAIFSFGDEPSASATVNFDAGTYGFYFAVRNENILVGTYGALLDPEHLVWELADNKAYFYLDDSNIYADRDFNDMVVEGTAPAVPVPAAAWLLGSGIAGLTAFRARRKQA